MPSEIVYFRAKMETKKC